MMFPNQPVILCADDSKIATNARCAVLQDFGYKVLCAYSGAETMEIVNRQDRLDLVLLDYEIGDTDASVLLPAINTARPELKVALLTGSAELDGFPGANAVFVKPLAPPKLAEEVRKLLGGGE
jgi:CheY-like chemotaxis protein